jgi:DNA-binding response OmpR family regulator
MSQMRVVLVVEDDWAVAEFIAEVLGDEGYAVRTVGTGAQARAALSIQPPSLVLCDLHLPDIAGSSLLSELRRDGHADVCVVMMTADADRARAISAQGDYPCLSKPFDLDDLLACVATNIRRHESAT